MQVEPLAQGFGAKISGFDVLEGRDTGDVATLRAAYDEHHLLVFNAGAAIPPERHVEIAGWFGPVGANTGAGGQPWTLLDNEQAVGRDVLPFHCDISFMEQPFEGLSLHPVALPEGPTSTTFTSNALGWDNLPGDLQDLLAERRVRHRFHDEEMVGLDWPELQFWHPARLPHPVTARPLLFVSENHVQLIEGMDETESAPILQRVFAVQYARERRCEHVWQSGDLLVWNNLAIQHARTQIADPGQGRRIMQRVALGKAGMLDQVEKLRADAA